MHMSYSLKTRPALHDTPLSPIFGESSNGENGYYQNILVCFNKLPMLRLNASWS